MSAAAAASGGYLDPDVANFVRLSLAEQTAGTAPATVDEARRAVSQRTQRLTSPVAARCDTRQVTIPGRAGDIRVVVHVPHIEDGPLPVIVYFHGGGCVFMSPEDYVGVTTNLAMASGCVVAVPDYRLAPEHQFPAPLEDALATVQWFRDHGGDLGADSERLVVAGDSGGGYLAAAVCLEARRLGLRTPDYQALVYPQTDMAASHRAADVDCSVNADLARWMAGFETLLEWTISLHVPGDRTDPRASPLRAADLSGLPPALLITAQYDLLAAEGRAYARRLRSSSVPVTHAEYSGVHHGFLQYGGVIAVADEAIHHVAAAVRNAVASRSAGSGSAGVAASGEKAAVR
jgi:acetyl esterase